MAVKALLLLFAALPAFATVSWTITNGDGTAGSGSCAIKGLRGSSSMNGNSCIVVLSGTGSYTTTNSNVFGPEARFCQTVYDSNPADDNPTGSPVDCTGSPSGTISSGTVELRIRLDVSDFTTVPGAHCPYSNGIYNCTFTGLTINGVSVPVTAAIRERVAPAVMSTTNKKTAADLVSEGCSYSMAYLMQYPDVCPLITPTYPNSVLEPPAKGASVVDERYGTTGKMLEYSVAFTPINRLISASGRYIIVQADTPAPDGIYDMQTGQKVYDFPAGVSGMQFYPNAARLAAMNLPDITLSAYSSGGNMVRLTGVTPPTLTQTAAWTAPHGEAMIQDGGSGTITSDGKRIIYACTVSLNCGQDQPVSAWPYVYVVDVYTNEYREMNWTDARVAAGFPNTVLNRRGVLMTDMDAEGRYSIQSGQQISTAVGANAKNVSMYFWLKWSDGTWGTSGTENDNNGGKIWAARDDCLTYASYCSGVLHQSPINVGGNMVWFKSNMESSSEAGVASNALFSPSPYDKTLPIEWGGGGSFFHSGVEHITCTVAPWSLCTVTYEPKGTENEQMPITSIAGNPAVITLEENASGNGVFSLTGLTTGMDVLIGCYENVSGSTQALGGFYTVSTIQTSPYRLTLTGLNWTGTALTARHCAVTRKQAPLNSQDRYQTVVARFAPYANGARVIQVFPIQRTRSVNFKGGVDGAAPYWGVQTKSQIAPNGLVVTSMDNYGKPNIETLTIWDVPWQARATKPYELAPGYPVEFVPTGSGNMTVKARVPTSDTLTCTVSTTADLLTSPTTVTLAGPMLNRTQTFSGTPKQKYEWQCRTTKDDFAAAWYAVPL